MSRQSPQFPQFPRSKHDLVPLALGCLISLLAPLVSAQDGTPGTPIPAPSTGSPSDPPDVPAAPLPTGRDTLPPVVKPPPNIGPSLRRSLRSPNGPAPGPGTAADPSGARASSAWNGKRGWECWWELYRDRFVRLEPRDTSVVVGQVPPDPRTSVQLAGTRVGSFERIEPSLRWILDREPSELVRSRALVSLAKLGENPLIPGSRSTYATILPFVYDSDARLSDAAITALGILGTEEALFPLGDLIEGVQRTPSDSPASSTTVSNKSFSDRQRALALYAMGLIGRDSTREDVRRLVASRICALFNQDADASAEVKFAALHALSLVPLGVESSAPRAVDSVEKPRKSRGFGEPRAVRAPRKTGVPQIPSASRTSEVEWVLSVVDDENEAGWIRAQAVTAAARLCSDLEDGSAIERKVAERLLKCLAPRSPDCIEIEQSAALALGELGDGDSDELDARVRSALVAASADSTDQATREFAIMSLALVGSRPGGNVGESDRLSASSEVRRVLVHRASKGRSNELPWTALALGVFERCMLDASGASARESRTLLTDLLIESNSAEIAAACSLAIGLCGASEARSELTGRLRDGDVAVRGYASLALGMSGARDAAPAIERVMNEARQAPQLYRETSEALTLLGAQVSRQLLGVLSAGASIESKMSVCLALGRVGDGKSLRALCQLASDPAGLLWVRASATSALGTMGSQRGGDWKSNLGPALNFLSLPQTLTAATLDGLLDLD